MAVKKCYISNLSGEWSRERQLEVLGDIADDTSIHFDKLGAIAKKEKRASALKDRDALLASFRAGEGDELHVASWPCLVVGPDDQITLTAETDRLGVTIVVHDIAMRIEPGSAPTRIKAARDALANAKRSRDTETAREAAMRRRRERTQARAAKIKEDWPKRDHTTEELLIRAGERGKPMAYITARNFWGKRPEMQALRDADMAREEGGRLARERRNMKRGDGK